ncbi:hypothetical protein F8S13_27310 [Chloroflexia bacterium SDU3-3]|nr:hypothetical protein F8S13_27310 [Chloroflexia bacterium SDU3-3]
MDEWIDISEASRRIKRTDRQVRRYVEKGRIRSRRRGAYVEYHAGDVDTLAAELPQDERPRAEPQQLMTRGEMLGLVERLQQQLAEAAAREGYLRAQLEQRPELPDTQAVKDDLVQARAERDALQHQIDALQQGSRRAWILALAALAILAIVVILVLVLH